VYHSPIKVPCDPIRAGLGTAIFRRLTDSFQDTDISAWGIAALVSGAIAVFSANVAGYIPNNILAGLHSTRLQSGNINQISSHLDQLRGDTLKMSRDYRTLLSRFELLNDDSGE